MSLFLLLTFISDVKCGTNAMTETGMYLWALFSIADALWARTLWGK